MGGADRFLTAALLYILTGVGSGLANIPAMALVSAWFRPSLRARAAGFMVIGSGFAMMLSGFLIPFLNGIYAGQGWRYSWWLLGGIVLAAALVCHMVIRDRPEEMELTPLGHGTDFSRPRDPGRYQGLWEQVSTDRIVRLAAIYFCFGASYVIYITFAVVAMIGEKGLSEASAGRLWALIGLLSLFSGPVPGWLADKTSRRTALCLVFAIQALAYLLAGLPLSSDLGARASVVCYGIVAWSVPGIMTALVADTAGPAHTARLFSLVTLVLATGQMLGPAAAGLLTDLTGSFSSGFYLASATALTGMTLSWTLKPRER